jgi:hypothetical protein
VAEGEGCEVAVEDADHAARSNHARGLADDGRGIVDVAQQRMRHDRVEGAGCEVEASGVAGPEVDAIRNSFGFREPPSVGHEARAQVDAGDLARESSATRDRSCDHAGPTTQVEHRLCRVDQHRVEIVREHPREHGLLAARFESVDDDLDRGVVEPIRHRVRIDWAHRSSLSPALAGGEGSPPQAR